MKTEEELTFSQNKTKQTIYKVIGRKISESRKSSRRKLEGISLNYVNLTFGKTYTKYLEEQADRHLNQRNLFWDGDYLKVAKKAKFITDGIAADLFII